jgi:hypothetical protein
MITGFFAGGKRPGREGDQFRPSGTENGMGEAMPQLPLYACMSWTGNTFISSFFTFLRVSKYRLSAINLCNNDTANVCTYNMTLRRVRAANVAVHTQ